MLTEHTYQDLSIAELHEFLRLEDRVNDDFSSNEFLRRENQACFRLSLTPLVLTKQQLETMETAARLLYSALAKATVSVISQSHYDDRWTQHRDFTSLNAAKRRFAPPLFLARFDMILDDDDAQFKVMEFNPACPVGVCFFHYWRRYPLSAFPWKDLRGELARFPFDDRYCFIRKLIDTATTGYHASSPLHVVLANDNAGLTLELPAMARCFQDLGHRVSLQRLDQLSLSKGHLRDQNGDPIDLIYYKARAARSTQRGWWRSELENYAGFLTAYENDLTCIFNPLPGYTVAEDKAMLAYMRRGDFDGILTEAERLAIRTHVPDTYVAGEWSQGSNKQTDFLVKPRCGSRGGGIQFGKDCTPSMWEKLIQCPDLLTQRWVHGKPQSVPTIKDGNPELTQMTHTVSVFMLQGVPMGVWSRVSAADLHNAAAGGAIQPVVIQ